MRNQRVKLASVIWTNSNVLFRCLAMMSLLLMSSSSFAIIDEIGDLIADNAVASAVFIDCNDSNEPSNPKTNNLITISAWTDEGTHLGTVSKVPDCDSIEDDHSLFYTNNIDYIVIQTNGSDAFWMDEIYIDVMNTNGSERTGFGIDGGNGWCLSKDPNDTRNSSWKNKVSSSGCQTAFRYNLSAGTIYAVPAPVSSPTQKWNYSLYIDCHHSLKSFSTEAEVANADTNNKITLHLYSGSSKISTKTINGADCSIIADEEIKITNVANNNITSIRLYTNGTDALYIDQLELDKTHSKGWPNTRNVDTWGADKGKGWCLSKDRDDANGSWRDYLTSDDACFRKLKFTVDSDTWYGWH